MPHGFCLVLENVTVMGELLNEGNEEYSWMALQALDSSPGICDLCSCRTLRLVSIRDAVLACPCFVVSIAWMELSRSVCNSLRVYLLAKMDEGPWGFGSILLVACCRFY